jgi:hypothetical protein
MKEKIIYSYLSITVLLLLVSLSVFAQKNRREGINKETGKYEYVCSIPLGDAYTLGALTIVKVDSIFYGTSGFIRFSSNKFDVTDDCPMRLILKNGKMVELEILRADKIKTTFGDVLWGGVIATSDKEFHCKYEVHKDDVITLTESLLVEARQYFHSDKNLNGSAKDEYGTYFTLDKTKEKEIKLFIENLKWLLTQ